MKTSSITIIILVILCLVLGLVIAIKLPCSNNPVNTDDSAVRWLQTLNDSLLKANQDIDRQTGLYRRESDSLRQKLLNTKQTIENLKTKQHEKTTRLDSLNSLELYSYFAKFNP